MTPDETARTPARRKVARPGATRTPLPAHPAAPPPRARLGLDTPALARATDATIVLQLPTARGRPLPSPAVALGTGDEADDRTDHDPRRNPVELAPWTVPTLAIDPVDAVSVLLDLAADAATDDDGWPMRAPSVASLAAIAAVAVDLVLRGRFLPALGHVPDGESVTGRWLPIPGSGDLERLRAIAAALPAVLRATITVNGPHGETGSRVIERVVGDIVDALARRALAGTGASPSPSARGRTRRAATPTETWLASLSAPRPTPITGPPRPLTDGLAAWHASAAVGSRRLRGCFSLAAPDDDAPDRWRLEVLLQSAMDPSLRVPAGAIWGARSDVVGALERALGDPQEELLAELGRASRLYPPLTKALAEARPTGLDLDATGAHGFLRDAAPQLSEAGFGVLLPSWWRAGRPRLTARVHARSTSRSGAVASSGIGMESLVEVDWQLALGDEVLDARELQELAALKAPLVRLRGQWVELRPEDLAAAARLIDRNAASAPETLMAAEVLRLGTGIDDAPMGLPITGISADGWLGDLLQAGEAGEAGGPRALPRAVAPDGFAGTLRPYQLQGLAWLESMSRQGVGACLADDMGLGKTAQLIALLIAEREDAATSVAPTLVICPMSIVGNWGRELARFAPDLVIHVHHGPERLAADELAALAPSADVVLTTYGLVTRDRDALARIRWGRVVLDEAQAIKNSGARQSQAVRSLAAPSRIALTGTPVENRLAELWSIMEFLNPGLLGSANGFRRRFAVPIERYRDVDAAARLRRVTAPFILRRLKSDRSIIRDLPSKIETTVDCRLTREQATLYQAIVDDMLARIDDAEGIERRGLVLTTMLRLKQACNHPAQLLGDGSPVPGRSGKLARLEELLEEVLAEGDRALLFTQFAAFGTMLRGHLRERFRREVLYLHGGTSRADRDAMVARFESADGPPLFVLSLKAGGTGLNLTAANHVFHVDRWWNPAVEDQATDRAYRIGQRKSVQVHKFVCVGTLEERIAALIASKRELAAMVVGAGEHWLTELSTDELRDLLRLSADAVDD